MKTALITGITGQDGSYLAEHLLSLGYRVVGMPRRASSPRLDNLAGVIGNERFSLVDGDMCDQSSLVRVLRESMPDEIYNLAAQSFVGASFTQPAYTFDVNATGVIRLLDAVRLVVPAARVYQASTSEMFGDAPAPQSETTPFAPRSPYAIAKVAAHHVCAHYRQAYSMHVSCGILMNHESPRRGVEFVTRKITRAVARIKLGKQSLLVLGNLDAKRDWGDARDYVIAMHLMLQQATPDDYVIATGVSRSVAEFVDRAFTSAGFGYGMADNYVSQDPAFMRPSDIAELRGDSRKAGRVLGWEPQIGFVEMVIDMVNADLERESGGTFTAVRSVADAKRAS